MGDIENVIDEKRDLLKENFMVKNQLKILDSQYDEIKEKYDNLMKDYLELQFKENFDKVLVFHEEINKLKVSNLILKEELKREKENNENFSQREDEYKQLVILNQENDNLKEQLKEDLVRKNLELNRLNEENRELKLNIENLEDEKITKEQSEGQLKDKIIQLEKSKNEVEEYSGELQVELDRVEAEKKEKEESEKKLKSQLLELEESKEKLTTELNDKIIYLEKSKKEVEEYSEELQVELDRVEAEKKGKEESEVNLKNLLVEFEKSKGNREKEIEELQFKIKTLEEDKEKGREIEIKLNNRIEELGRTKDESSEFNLELQGELERVKVEKIKIEENETDLKNQIIELEQLKESKETELNQLEVKVEELEAEKSVKEQSEIELNEKVVELEKSKKESEEYSVELQSELDRLESEKIKIEENETNLRNQIVELEQLKESKETELNQLEVKVEELEAEKSVKEQSEIELNVKVAELEKSKKESEEYSVELQSELDRLEAEKIKIEENDSILRNQIMELEKENEEKTLFINGFELKFEEIEGEKRRAEEFAKGLSIKVTELEKTKKNLENYSAAMATELTKTLEFLKISVENEEMLKNRVMELQINSKENEENLGKLNLEIKREKERIAIQFKVITEKENAVEEIKKEKEKLEKEKNSLEIELDKTKMKLEDAKMFSHNSISQVFMSESQLSEIEQNLKQEKLKNKDIEEKLEQLNSKFVRTIHKQYDFRLMTSKMFATFIEENHKLNKKIKKIEIVDVIKDISLSHMDEHHFEDKPVDIKNLFSECNEDEEHKADILKSLFNDLEEEKNIHLKTIHDIEKLEETIVYEKGLIEEKHNKINWDCTIGKEKSEEFKIKNLCELLEKNRSLQGFINNSEIMSMEKLEEFIDFFKFMIPRAIEADNPLTEKDMFYFSVSFAYYYYNGGDYWQILLDTLEIEDSEKPRYKNYLRKELDKVFKKYDFYQLKDETGDRVGASVIMHAIVPLKQTDQYLKIIEEIYMDEMKEDVDKNLFSKFLVKKVEDKKIPASIKSIEYLQKSENLYYLVDYSYELLKELDTINKGKSSDNPKLNEDVIYKMANMYERV